MSEANHAMLNIEVRRPVFAADAEVVLREELRRLGADPAGVVQRFRIGVGADEVEAVAETLVHLEGKGVVIRVAYVVHQLNHAIVRVGRTLQDALRRTIRIVPIGAEQPKQNRIIGIAEAIQVIAFRAQVSGLELPILAELLLDIEQPDLAVRSFVPVRIGEGVGRRDVGDGAAAHRIVPVDGGHAGSPLGRLS